MDTALELLRATLIGYLFWVLEVVTATLWQPLFYVFRLLEFLVLWTYSFVMMRSSRNSRGFWAVSFLGGSLNAIALAANGGKMPVFRDKADRVDFYGIHKKGSRSTRLKFLCDMYYGSFDAVFSLGDIIICISFGMLVAQALREIAAEVYHKNWQVRRLWKVM